MNKRIIVIFLVFLLISIHTVSAVEFSSVQNEMQTKIKENLNSKYEEIFKGETLDSRNTHSDLYKTMESLGELKANFQDSYLNSLFSKILNGNYTSLFIIGALICSLIFLITTQPIFLQLIVETGTQTIFIGLLFSLIVLELIQKFFALKAFGLWDTYITGETDGIWNFLSIVFISVYFKIYFSYLPTFIIQYSQVIVKAFFYLLMFAIPILFNFCIADSMDLIDWNGDERENLN